MIRLRRLAVGVSALVLFVASAQSGRPDLIVSGLNTPDGLKQGTCNRFDVTVENLSDTGTTRSITVRLHLKYANNGEGQHIKVLRGIGSRGKRDATQLVTFAGIAIPPVGRVSYTATVNPDGVVPEIVVDERNSASGSGAVVGSCP